MTIEHSARRFAAGTHAVIDLDAYRQNVRELRSLAPEGAEFMAVVKADAYGHGSVQCALAAQSVADWLGVARVQEALALRRRGVIAPILVLGPANALELREAIRNDITLTVGANEHLDQLAIAANQEQRAASVHLKIDTGMRRYGFMPHVAAEVAARINDSEWLALDGVYTHFSSSDETDTAPTLRQIGDFEDAVTAIRARGVEPRRVHCANSAAIIARLTGSTNLVRSGIATYGISPSEEVPVSESFTQVMSVRTVVTRVFDLQPGDSVSYGRSYLADACERVANTAVGYADGLPRQLSNTGWFVRDGQRFPIRGRVCMDQTVVGGGERLEVGSTLDVIRPAGHGAMTLDDIARIAGTNAYEIATRLTARVPRLYIEGGVVVACEHLLLSESHSANQER